MNRRLPTPKSWRYMTHAEKARWLKLEMCYRMLEDAWWQTVGSKRPPPEMSVVAISMAVIESRAMERRGTEE